MKCLFGTDSVGELSYANFDFFNEIKHSKVSHDSEFFDIVFIAA